MNTALSPKEQQTRLRLFAVAYLIFNIFYLFSGFYKNTYDSMIYLFFASHYQSHWFELINCQWYGGFEMASYPPLLFQLLALFGRLMGLNNAYLAVNLAVMLMLPACLYWYCRTVFPRTDMPFYCTILSLGWLGLWRSSYIEGKLTGIFALAMVILAADYLYQYLSQGGRDRLLLFALFLGSGAAAHHLTAVLFAPALMAVTIGQRALTPQSDGLMPSGLKQRIAWALGVGLLISAVVVWPFWRFAYAYLPQKEIEHFSRNNLLLIDLDSFLNIEYLLLAGLIPASLIYLRRKKSRSYLVFWLTGTIFFLLALGGTTPIVKLAFGTWWNVITYDRFLLWSAFFLIPLFGASLSRMSTQNQKTAFGLILLLSTLYVAYLYNKNIQMGKEKTRVDITDTLNFLEDPGNQPWRYLTLGYGNSSIELSMRTRAESIDGFYPTARKDAVLRNSGIYSLDIAKYSEAGKAALRYYLANPQPYHLKWVFCADPYYDFYLKKYHFTKIEDWNQNGACWLHADIQPLSAAGRTPRNRQDFTRWFWGSIPLLVFGSALATALARQPGFIRAMRAAATGQIRQYLVLGLVILAIWLAAVYANALIKRHYNIGLTNGSYPWQHY